MDRDCARLERRFPKKILGTIVVALLFTAATWFAYEYSLIEMKLPVGGQSGAAVEPLIDPFAGTTFEARAVYVIDTQGRVRMDKNGDAQLPLASITKIALVLAASEVLPKDMLITIKRDISGNGKGDTLPAGTTWKVQDLIDFTLVASSNDGAEELARAADAPIREKYPEAPQGRATLWRMNMLIKDIGLKNTYFTNVTGLDESATQSGAYGSARDVAALMLYAMAEHPETFSATKMESVTVTSTTGVSASVKNTDEALPAISGLVMGKTGLTDLAGGNLTVTFDARGRRYAAVVLGSTEEGRFADMTKIAKILARTK